MTALAALNLRCEVSVLERNPFSPGARLAPTSFAGDWGNPELLASFAAGADVITLENEFVDAGVLRQREAAGRGPAARRRNASACRGRLHRRGKRTEIVRWGGRSTDRLPASAA